MLPFRSMFHGRLNFRLTMTAGRRRKKGPEGETLRALSAAAAGRPAASSPGYCTGPTSLKPGPSITVSMTTPGTSPFSSNSWLPAAPS